MLNVTLDNKYIARKRNWRSWHYHHEGTAMGRVGHVSGRGGAGT